VSDNANSTNKTEIAVIESQFIDVDPAKANNTLEKPFEVLDEQDIEIS